ncbi:uncharacterized protein LOC106868183 [Octopus bimaculoides]|nr:uncharacterized protein LOC106868183 [Octopus bimaculoides]|eukprot:XP_014768818.1 PREDICTED: uncharacterized protein LOC106868183 [Octopus bimaculoides]
MVSLNPEVRAASTEVGMKVNLKLHLKNAFNSISQEVILRSIRENTPPLYQFAWQAYWEPSYLSFGDHVISSVPGVQQGDPLGPDVTKMGAGLDLNIWYLNDACLEGPPDKVLAIARMGIEELDCRDLSVNKLWLLDHPVSHENVIIEIFYFVFQIDLVCFEEFCQWREQSQQTEQPSSFLSRVFLEDISPCLNFSNTNLSERVKKCVDNNTLTIEPIASDSSYPRWCTLSQSNKLCNYKIHLGEDHSWYSISEFCRNRITSVCNFYTYIRYIQQGLVKGEDKSVFLEVLNLRKKMALARLGYS